jgi:hypothetical protein
MPSAMPMPPFGDTLPHINENEKFDGVNKDVYDFFNTFKAISTSYGWLEMRQLQVLGLFLTGPALQFWQTLEPSYKMSIQSVYQAFIRQYGKVKADYLTEFYSARPTQDQRV